MAEKTVHKRFWAHFPQRREFHPAVPIWRCLPPKCGSMMLCLWVSVSVWVCVVRGDPRLSWLGQGVGEGGGEDTIRPWFLWLWWHPDTHTHTLDTLAQASPLAWVCHHWPLFLSFSLSLSHIQTDAHTKTQTHAPKPENYSLACERWADGLPNDCCVQCKGSVLHSHYTSSLQLTRPQSTDLAFIYFTF